MANKTEKLTGEAKTVSKDKPLFLASECHPIFVFDSDSKSLQPFHNFKINLGARNSKKTSI